MNEKKKDEIMVIAVVVFAVLAILIIISSYVGATGQAIAQIQTDMVSFFHNANVITPEGRTSCNVACGGNTCILAKRGNDMYSCQMISTGLTCVCTSKDAPKVELKQTEIEETEVNYKSLKSNFEIALNYVESLILEHDFEEDMSSAYDFVFDLEKIDNAILNFHDKQEFIGAVKIFETKWDNIGLEYNSNEELPIIKDAVHNQINLFITQWQKVAEEIIVPVTISEPTIEWDNLKQTVETPQEQVVTLPKEEIVEKPQPVELPQKETVTTPKDVTTIRFVDLDKDSQSIIINSINGQRNELINKVDTELRFKYTESQRTSIKNIINYDYDNLISNLKKVNNIENYNEGETLKNKWISRLE